MVRCIHLTIGQPWYFCSCQLISKFAAHLPEYCLAKWQIPASAVMDVVKIQWNCDPWSLNQYSAFVAPDWPQKKWLRTQLDSSLEVWYGREVRYELYLLFTHVCNGGQQSIPVVRCLACALFHEVGCSCPEAGSFEKASHTRWLTGLKPKLF